MINQLHQIAKERGGRCLSDTCKNAHTIIWWECEKGHRWQATPLRVKLAANWCPVCAGRARITIEDMQDLAEAHGGKCLSDTYKGALTKLSWECSDGHRWEAIPASIKRGSWCARCAGVAINKTIKDMQEIAAERGGKCLSETYEGAHTKLFWQCSKGHEWEAPPSSITSGSWCPSCAGNAKHTIEEMQGLAGERGGRCLSDSYKNGMTKLLWQCCEGHQWEAMPMKVISGNWCRKCSRSKRYKHTKAKGI